MSDHLLHQLKKAAEEAFLSKSQEEGLKNLRLAFSLFSQETAKLKESYFKLQEQLKEVKQELSTNLQKLNQKKIENNAHEGNLDSILNGLSMGILIIDKELKIIRINEEALKMLNLKKETIILKNYFEIFKDDFFGFSLKHSLLFRPASKSSSIITVDRKHLEINMTFLKFQPGIMISIKDVSELRELKHLSQRNENLKELGKMSATIVHEIKNPLGGIRGFASLLHRDLKDQPHLCDMASHILEASKVLERLVSNLLYFSRPLDLKLEVSDIVSLLKNSALLAKAALSFPEKIQLSLHLTEEKLPLLIDKELLKTAILNLIINAFQAIEDKGEVTVSLFKNSLNCIISITDSGGGIAVEDIEKLFSPFFTTKEAGNGLGLCEAGKIIKAHGGTIEVRSQPKTGTTFTINLPLLR